MTENQIQNYLQNIKNTRNHADRDELIYDLGDKLGWTTIQKDIFYDMYYDDPSRYSAKELLPGGVVHFDFEMRISDNVSPI
ncbi:hypothetical protein M2G39_21190 [Vibrio vulnificus]|nr:hypothetical protein [Vibrio vulnificus]